MIAQMDARSGGHRCRGVVVYSDAPTITVMPMPDLQPLRLVPGDDLRRALEARCASEGRSGFVVAGIGSLTDARLRLAAADGETVVEGPSELLSLSGSLSPDGAHLHASVADAQGRVTGGHLAHGCVVRTTAELLIAWLDEWALSRRPDAATGFKELDVRPRAAP